MSSLVCRRVLVGRLAPRLSRCSVTRFVRQGPPVTTTLSTNLEQRRWLGVTVLRDQISHATSGKKNQDEQMTARDQEEEEKTPRADQAVANQIITALDQWDYRLASQLFQSGLASRSLQASTRIVLERFKEADLGEAAIVSALAANSLDKPGSVLSKSDINRHTRSLLMKFAVSNDIKGLTDFVASLSKNQKLFMSDTIEAALRTAKLLHSPSEYLEMLQNDSARETLNCWALSNKILRRVPEDTISQLLEVASTGSVAAMGSLCRLALGRGDRRLLEESWLQLQDKSFWAKNIFNMPAKDDIDLFRKTMKREELAEVLKWFLDHSTGVAPSSLVELTTVAMSETSLQLGDLQDHTLKCLARARDFQDRDKVKEILEARKCQANTAPRLPREGKKKVEEAARTDGVLAARIIAAIDGKDFSLANSLIEEGIEGKSLNESTKSVLEKFVEADLVEGAKASAFATNSLDKDGSVLSKMEINRHMRAVIIKFGVTNNLAGLAEFVDSLSKSQAVFMSNTVTSALKTASFLHSPTEYLKLIINDPTGENSESWAVGTKVMKRVSKDMILQLEELAREGNVAAVCSLCRVGLGREDRALLERSWERLSDKDKVSWGRWIVSRPGKRDIQLFSATMRSEDQAQLYKQYLDLSHRLTLSSLVLVTEAALSHTSLQMADLQEHTRQSLARVNKSGGRAKDVLEGRGGTP